ncbi:MAG: hypothetical protein JWM14_2361 [Chitinophagaceae bacterium]|nr:hypothetical protein [Chitinophagaceae bacterium]
MFKKILSALAKNPWKTYAASIGAEYIDGGFQSDRIIVNDQNFTIIITLGTNQRGNTGFRYTRFRCSYTSSQSPYFSIKPKKFHLMKGLFSKKDPNLLPIQKLYDITAPKEELFSILSEDDEFCLLLNNISIFKYSSEKDDGEYGPTFLPSEHQFCLELEGEIEEASLLDAGIGIILATVRLFRNNDLFNAEKSTVQY